MGLITVMRINFKFLSGIKCNLWQVFGVAIVVVYIIALLWSLLFLYH